jgi:uncharacterized protein (TIRG00374 family)
MSVGYDQSTASRVPTVPAAPAEDSSTQAKRGQSRLGLVLKLGFTLVVSAYVLWQAGLSDALWTLAAADWRLVALGALSSVVAMVINVKRWQIMLGGQREAAPMPTLIRLYLVAMFFNNILPSRFGGDIVRAYGASIRLTTRTRSAAAVVMDRLVGAISVLLLGVIAISLRPSVIPWQISEVIVVGLVVAVLAVGALFIPGFWQKATHRLVPLVSSLPVLGSRLGKRVAAAVEAVRSYADRPMLVLWALAISMVANGLSIVNVYLYALAVGADVHLAEAAVVTPVVLAVGLLPLSINGLGTIELTYVLLLGLMGVDPQVALAVAILRRMVLLGQSLVGGVLYASRRFG